MTVNWSICSLTRVFFSKNSSFSLFKVVSSIPFLLNWSYTLKSNCCNSRRSLVFYYSIKKFSCSRLCKSIF